MSDKKKEGSKKKDIVLSERINPITIIPKGELSLAQAFAKAFSLSGLDDNARITVEKDNVTIEHTTDSSHIVFQTDSNGDVGEVTFVMTDLSKESRDSSIRKDYKNKKGTQAKLGKKYNLSQSEINKIVNKGKKKK